MKRTLVCITLLMLMSFSMHGAMSQEEDVPKIGFKVREIYTYQFPVISSTGEGDAWFSFVYTLRNYSIRFVEGDIFSVEIIDTTVKNDENNLTYINARWHYKDFVFDDFLYPQIAQLIVFNDWEYFENLFQGNYHNESFFSYFGYSKEDKGDSIRYQYGYSSNFSGSLYTQIEDMEFEKATGSLLYRNYSTSLRVSTFTSNSYVSMVRINVDVLSEPTPTTPNTPTTSSTPTFNRSDTSSSDLLDTDTFSTSNESTISESTEMALNIFRTSPVVMTLVAIVAIGRKVKSNA